MAELCQADPFLRGIYEEGVTPYATPAVEGMPVRHSVRGAGTLTELVSELRDTSGALLHVWLFQPEGHSWPEAESLAPAEDRDPAGFFPSQDPTPAESCSGERGGYL
ncbi:hypothetical protein ABZ545_30415 [Streptomyces abikoensis]|uniref:hypothetical protein n=1 Tax=Streptomyces abikoensis TaxID=97398 RepID=UPI0033CC7339